MKLAKCIHTGVPWLELCITVPPADRVAKTCVFAEEKFAVKAFKLRGVSKDKRKELESEAVPSQKRSTGFFLSPAGACVVGGGSKEIFLAMDHPHVASLVDVYESEEQLFLVMESWQSRGRSLERSKEPKRAFCKALRSACKAASFLTATKLNSEAFHWTASSCTCQVPRCGRT